jgi:hypothetical protein
VIPSGTSRAGIGAARPRGLMDKAGQVRQDKEKNRNFRILQFIFHANCGLFDGVGLTIGGRE